MKNYRDGRTYTSEYGLKAVQARTPTEPMPTQVIIDANDKKHETGLRDRITCRSPKTAEHAGRDDVGGERAVAPAWVVWLNRTFWLSWLLFLFNLHPGVPARRRAVAAVGRLGADRLPPRRRRRRVQRVRRRGHLPDRVDRRERVAVHGAGACSCSTSRRWRCIAWRSDDGPFGYDFSAGYTSLEKDDEPPPQAEASRAGSRAGGRPAARARSSARPRSARATRSGWTNSSRRSPAPARNR